MFNLVSSQNTASSQRFDPVLLDHIIARDPVALPCISVVKVQPAYQALLSKRRRRSARRAAH